MNESAGRAATPEEIRKSKLERLAILYPKVEKETLEKALNDCKGDVYSATNHLKHNLKK